MQSFQRPDVSSTVVSWGRAIASVALSQLSVCVCVCGCWIVQYGSALGLCLLFNPQTGFVSVVGLEAKCYSCPSTRGSGTVLCVLKLKCFQSFRACGRPARTSSRCPGSAGATPRVLPAGLSRAGVELLSGVVKAAGVNGHVWINHGTVRLLC